MAVPLLLGVVQLLQCVTLRSDSLSLSSFVFKWAHDSLWRTVWGPNDVWKRAWGWRHFVNQKSRAGLAPKCTSCFSQRKSIPGRGHSQHRGMRVARAHGGGRTARRPVMEPKLGGAQEEGLGVVGQGHERAGRPGRGCGLFLQVSQEPLESETMHSSPSCAIGQGRPSHLI